MRISYWSSDVCSADLKVSREEGVGGFVFPGDRVDVVLAQQLSVDTENSSYPDKELYTAETIIRNVRVLATDQRYNAEDETGKTPVRTFSSVTLEATPEIAEKTAVAQDRSTERRGGKEGERKCRYPGCAGS